MDFFFCSSGPFLLKGKKNVHLSTLESHRYTLIFNGRAHKIYILYIFRQSTICVIYFHSSLILSIISNEFSLCVELNGENPWDINNEMLKNGLNGRPICVYRSVSPTCVWKGVYRFRWLQRENSIFYLYIASYTI